MARSHWTKDGTQHFCIPRCMYTLNLGSLPKMIQEICPGQEYSKNQVRGQGHSDPKMVCDTLQSQDALTH